MEDYLKILLEQIRCKKACPRIEREVRSHIEDQAEANRIEWKMEEEEAMKCALRDMGDPVEAGVKLDQMHKPQIAWALVAVMAIVSLFSFVIHVMIGMGMEESAGFGQENYIFNTFIRIVIGFLAMFFVYRLDYSILAGRGKLFATVFLFVMTAEIFFFGTMVNGRTEFIGGSRISILYIMFLYVPLYGAVLYQYRGSGWKGIGKSLLFMLYPVWLTLCIPCISFSVLLLLIMSVMLTAAVQKGWFFVSKKWFLSFYWGSVCFLPVVLGFITIHFAKNYQQARLESILGGEYRQNDYVTAMLINYLKGSRIFGAGSETVVGNLPDYYSDYILTFISGSYGIAAAVLLCLLIGLVVVKIFRIAFLQRNQLGMIIGLGSGLVLMTNTGLNILENMGILPRTFTFFPFFSNTGTGIIVTYILVGIVLSVYRYKNILPEDQISRVSEEKFG